MYTYKEIAERFGISEKIEALEKALLSIDGVEKVDFDLNGFFDEIHQVIMIPKVVIKPVDWKSEEYFEKRKKALESILKVSEDAGLSRTSDAIEDMGEHYYIVTSARKWKVNSKDITV